MEEFILGEENFHEDETCFIFEKKGETTPKSHKILTKIAPSDSTYQRTVTTQRS